MTSSRLSFGHPSRFQLAQRLVATSSRSSTHCQQSNLVASSQNESVTRRYVVAGMKRNSRTEVDVKTKPDWFSEEARETRRVRLLFTTRESVRDRLRSETVRYIRQAIKTVRLLRAASEGANR